MTPIQCPGCGAPAQVSPGQSTYECPFCKQSFQTAAQPAPNEPPAQVVILTPGFEIEKPAARPVPRGVKWVLAIAIPLMILGPIVGIGASLWVDASATSPPSVASAAVWDGKAPFVCGANDVAAATGVKATFTAGAAVMASGNCQFTCTDCAIEAPTAIAASGNAHVTFLNGSVVGRETLVTARENAVVNVAGNVTASGAIESSENATVSAPKPAGSAPTTRHASRAE